MTALTAGWLTVSPSSTTARTSALVAKSARDWPAPCRRCPFFRLALPTESDRTPSAGAPQGPGRDGGDGGLRQGDGGASRVRISYVESLCMSPSGDDHGWIGSP